MTRARDFQIIAHRGAKAVRPENTMAAFDAAIGADANMIELDLTLCATGEFVVIHDDVLDRTTDGSGLVCEWTLDDLLKLDAGSWFAPEFSTEHIPTVLDVLDGVVPRIPVNIEIKPLFAVEQRDAFVAAMSRLVEMVKQRKFRDRVLVSSFNFFVLRWLRRRDEHLRLAYLYNKSIADIDPVWACTDVRAEACNPRQSLVTPALVERLHAARLKCYPYVVNSKARLLELADMGVDGVFSDDPESGARLLR